MERLEYLIYSNEIATASLGGEEKGLSNEHKRKRIEINPGNKFGSANQAKVKKAYREKGAGIHHKSK